MPLAVGARLGPYEILSAVGAGGMGEVYRARDTRLDRTVAIKVLVASLAADPQLRERFDREARAISALNHPHICTLYDVGHQDGVDFLVLEYLDGETLADRMRRSTDRPLPPDEALRYAIQIADALDKAHRSGIVHRDLKPANVFLVRSAGASAPPSAKLLDFGLAKTAAPVISTSGLSMLPTTPPALTAQGTILGTFQYMAPEQIEGLEADARTDIFAFGCVLFEMLTGKKAFEGKTHASLLGAILKDEPPTVSQLQKAVPTALDRIVATCLAKDPDDRWQTARDLMRELKWVADESMSPDLASPTVSSMVPGSVWSRALPWAVAGAFGVALIAALVAWSPWRPTPVATPRKLLASIGADASLPTDIGAAGASASLSPDGTTLVFVGQQGGTRRLFTRKLDQLQAAAIAGTEGAANPFFSPDGQWIAFFARGKLKKISATSGASVTLCDAPTGRGGTWTDDDTIIFTPSNASTITLVRVPAAGGTPVAFGTLSKGAATQRWPQALPAGKGVLYSENSSSTGWDTANLVVAPLSGGTAKVVVRGAHYGRYVPSGHIVYMRQGTLFAVPFDLARMETVGQGVPALEGISADPVITGSAEVAFASDGTLVYVPGMSSTNTNPIEWMTRDGKTSILRATKAYWANPRFSPDGRKLALEIFDGKQRDIWMYEWAQDRLTQLTFDPGQDTSPVWTPDGQRIVFASDRAKAGVANLYWVSADGSGDTTRLTESSESQVPASWHPSGKFLTFMSFSGPTAASALADSLMILPMDGDAVHGWTPGKPTVFLASPALKVLPMFSPDGRWIAYSSNEAGGGFNTDVYVRPFPGPGGQWRVSTEGGMFPRWSGATHELIFLDLNRTVMSASYDAVGDSFHAGKPQVWSPTAIRGPRVGNAAYDLHPDGKRLAALAAVEQASGTDKVVFVFNFFDYLRTIAPGGHR